jgi:hypothetical protein
MPERFSSIEVVPAGTFRSILNQAGISLDEFKRKLRDDDAKTYAQLALKRDQILPLHFSNHHEQPLRTGRHTVGGTYAYTHHKIIFETNITPSATRDNKEY